MQEGRMHRVGGAFQPLQPVAHLYDAERQAVRFGRRQELEIGNQRRLAFAQIRPDGATFFLHRICDVPHRVAELLVFGLRRLIEALSLDVEEPTMIKAAQTTVLDSTIREIRAAMGAKLANQTEPVLVIAEQYKIFAHYSDRHRLSSDRHFLRRSDGLPITPQ